MQNLRSSCFWGRGGGGEVHTEELVEGNAPAAAPPMIEIVVFPYKQMTLPTLRDIAKAIIVQYWHKEGHLGSNSQVGAS